ncbi:exonuclease SbcCD subunit D [Pullulanibacillus sp. KACC 23026]|uniref:exonuclease SbcCD subunit D n=1 Tax=Pullulanibacillus sp. KACC 23026 TaxID=3028315 RepID=UPI0023AFAAF4|nr:exonuclease SbcCD subunit D [Pullulanibacillus sp. KACC 23026]WEG11790.1 exonuclease SbcCD subunit D [Pullulanibacillus sp. KACC 23026]
MKFFHTADWHLGKLVHGVYMTDDQRYVLDQFVEAVEAERPDAVIIAGDLYDRAVPPTDAVELLDDRLRTLVMDLKTPVIAIAGNHDSPGRLDFATQLMASNGLYLMGQLKPSLEPVILQDQYGEVHVHQIPYAEPAVIRHLLENEEIHSHQEAMSALIEQIEERLDPKARHILVGHAFVTASGESEPNTSDSERPLSIGGAEHVSAELFKSFHYTALGHLHQAHYVGNPTIRYSGSPLKYSISEEHHNKGYLVVELDQDGQVTVEHRSLKPKHEMRTVEGKLDDLLKGKMSEDYVFVRLLDETPILAPMEKIRSVYPNAMHVERILSQPIATQTVDGIQGRQTLTDQELFKAFYKEVTGEAPKEEAEALFIEVLDDVRKKEVELV